MPGMKPGRSDSIVELMDIYPTLSELAGLKIPAEVQGKSLVPILKDPTARVKDGAISFNKGHSLRTPDWHYMRYNDGTQELYNMNTDPNEFINQATNEQYAKNVKQLSKQLDETLAAHSLKPNKKK